MNSDDHVRTHLVTRFNCANCGNQLHLSYGKPPQGDYQPDMDDDITGARKVEISVAVHPCEKCYTAATAPIKALREAMKGIAT